MLLTSDRPSPGKPYGEHDGKNSAQIQYRADTLAALVAHVLSPEGKAKPPFDPESMTAQPSEQWDLKLGWQGTLDMARQGWPAGRRAVAAALATIPGDFHIAPPQLSDIAGGVLDAAAHVAGAPDCFDIDDDEAAGRARVVRLLVPLSASASVPAKHLLNRGAAIASIIDALEAARISCEVEAMSCHESRSSHDQVCIRHTVKRAGDPLNLDALATSICHPATFRRLHFAALESIGDLVPGFMQGFKPADICGGYGSPGSYKAMDLEEPGTYLVPAYNEGNHDTAEHSRQSVAEGMQKLGFNVSFEPATP